MSSEEESTGLNSGDPTAAMPYSVSVNSRRIAVRRSSCLMPFSPVERKRFIASFLARRTMFSIIAPELKSLKNRISLSPDAYVTSRNRFSSLSAYIFSTVRSIILRVVTATSPPALSTSSGWIGTDGCRYFDMMSAAWPQDRRVDQVLAVGGAYHDHVLQRLDAVELGEQLRDDRALDVGRDAGPARAEYRIHLVEKDDHRETFLRPLLRALEDLPDLPLGLPDVLVEELRALDVEEVRVRVLPSGPLLHLVRQRFRDGLRDQRFAATRRAVQEHALGRLELVLVEELRVQERQLDGITYLLDLTLEAADVLVGDVGNLLQDELLHLLLRELLQRHSRARVEQERVPGANALITQFLGEDGYKLLVGPAEH